MPEWPREQLLALLRNIIAQSTLPEEDPPDIGDFLAHPFYSRVRLFRGDIRSETSTPPGALAPAVLLAAESHPSRQTECLLAFFIPTPVLIKLKVEPLSASADLNLTGTAQDPRGWQVTWTATLHDHTITGAYHQPHDHGTMHLEEVPIG